LDDIWFYMNFRLNFSRLLREKRPVKLQQQLLWLDYVADKTVLDNAIIIYFHAYMQYRVHGEISGKLIQRLEQRMRESDYWQKGFELVGLSIDHVLNCKFPITYDCGPLPETLSNQDALLFKFPTKMVAA
jgi:hypothetical protein